MLHSRVIGASLPLFWRDPPARPHPPSRMRYFCHMPYTIPLALASHIWRLRCPLAPGPCPLPPPVGAWAGAPALHHPQPMALKDGNPPARRPWPNPALAPMPRVGQPWRQCRCRRVSCPKNCLPVLPPPTTHKPWVSRVETHRRAGPGQPQLGHPCHVWANPGANAGAAGSFL